MFHKILVAADDSPTAARAVRAAAELALAVGAELHVATAVALAHAAYLGAGATWLGAPSEIDVETLPTELAPHLQAILDELGTRASFHAASGEAAEVIVSVAELVGADLVVVGNRNMRGIRRMLGSVPNTVAHRASCSVLIFDSLSEPGEDDAGALDPGSAGS